MITDRMPLPVAILISGRGSNMLAIAEAARAGRIPVRVAAVVSDRPDAAGLASARDLGLPTVALSPKSFPDRASYDDALRAEVEAFSPGLVILAGFMRILSAGFVRAFGGRLFNIHPSLLPKYPGLHTHRRVLEAGDAWHGCTVHFVTEELDAGPAVIQARVRVRPGDTEDSLSARVHQWEHIIYPEATGWFAAGRLALREGLPWLDGARLASPVIRGEE
jgi:phosphoribosylglycinamide formyltransferase-1